MLSLILVVAIISFYPIKKKKFSENFCLFLLLGGCIFSFFYGAMVSYIVFYDYTSQNIICYEEKIYYLELELDELETSIENISSSFDLTEKEINMLLDGFLGKKSELIEQINSNTSKLNKLLLYNNPKLLKIAKFLIYFG